MRFYKNLNNSYRQIIWILTLGIAAPIATCSAEYSDNNLADVTVSARKRLEAADKVPVAIKVVNSAAIKLGSNNTHELAGLARSAVNTALSEAGGTYSNTFLIRGIGALQPLAADDATVAIYEDAVAKSTLSAPASLLDVARVEVLRGPQGTLFGRNTQGGAILIINNKPEFANSFSINGAIGNLGQNSSQIVANGKVSENSALRIAARHASRNGDIENLAQNNKTGEQQDVLMRAQLAWFVNDSNELNLSAWLHKNKNAAPRFICLENPDFPQVAINPANKVTWQDIGTRLEFNKQFSNIELQSLSSFEKSKVDYDFDMTDGLLFAAMFNTNSNIYNFAYKDYTQMQHLETRIQQELRLKNIETANFNWQLGANIFYSDFKNDAQSNAGKTAPMFTLQNGRQLNTIDTLHGAIFGDLDFALSAKMRANLGLRVGHERKKAEFKFYGNSHPAVKKYYYYQNKLSDNLLNARIAFSYQLADNKMLYSSIGRGATAGGMPIVSPNTAQGKAVDNYQQSHNMSYEVGIKYKSINERLQINAALFHNDVKNGHMVVFNPAAAMLVPASFDYYSNGAELETNLILNKFMQLQTGVALSNAKLINVANNNLAKAKNSNKVANVPQVTANSSLQIKVQNWFANLGVQYTGQRYADIQNQMQLAAYTLGNLNFGYAANKWQSNLYIRNIGNVPTQVGGQAWTPKVHSINLGAPRLWGAEFSYEF